MGWGKQIRGITPLIPKIPIMDRIPEWLAPALMLPGAAVIVLWVAGAIYIDTWGHKWPAFISLSVIRH